MSASGCAGAGMWPGQIVSTPEPGRIDALLETRTRILLAVPAVATTVPNRLGSVACFHVVCARW